MSSDKMNSSNVYGMFEEVKELGIQIKDKLMQTLLAPIQGLIDVSAVTDLAERLEIVIEEVRKPTRVERQHRHTILVRIYVIKKMNYASFYVMFFVGTKIITIFTPKIKKRFAYVNKV